VTFTQRLIRSSTVKNRLIATAAISTALALTLAGCSDADDSGDGSGLSGRIKASGSSAQKNAMAEWINAFQIANPGVTIDYQANGSGAGIQDFINNQTSFAGSDAALKPDEKSKADARCTDGEAINIPLVGGAIAVAYNLEGVDELTLTPEVIAGIFDSSITRWDDPKIADINAGAALPDAPIAQFHRSDESGTTANFSSYLAATAPDIWTYDAGKGWPAPGGQGSKGSDGVAASLNSTPNSIGYVELSFVLDGDLRSAKVDNGAGGVEATSANAAAAIEAAEVVGQGDDLALELDPTLAEPGAYPIVLVTYQIVCTSGLPAAELDIVKPFLQYASDPEAQGILDEIGYVPITGELLTKVQASIDRLS
jgi:phosphate transport system substrate-binding protein